MTLASFGYTVNAQGQRTQVSETLPDHSRTIDYAYDGLGRLTGADASTGTDYTYSYDVVGNRTEGGKTYNAANQVDGWTYDLKGRLTSDGTTTYGYDNFDRVIALNGVTQRYNGDGVLMQSGTITYTQDVALALPQVIQTLGTDYIYGADRLAEVSKTARTWYATDALGSVRLTTSDTGAALSSIDYDPWGQVERGAPARFGFTGELQQGSTVHLRARWYNATSGSFASVDPYAGDPASPASLAPYMYAYNQPTGFTDPSGRCIAEGHGDNTCEQQRSFEERLVSAYGKPIYEDVTFRNHRGADGLIAFFDANPQEALAYAAHPTSLQQSIEAAAYKGDAYVGDPYTVERLINITLGSWAKDYAQRYPGCDVGGNALLIAGLGGLLHDILPIALP